MRSIPIKRRTSSSALTVLTLLRVRTRQSDRLTDSGQTRHRKDEFMQTRWPSTVKFLGDYHRHPERVGRIAIFDHAVVLPNRFVHAGFFPFSLACSIRNSSC